MNSIRSGWLFRGLLLVIVLAVAGTASAQLPPSSLTQIRSSVSSGNYYFVSKPGDLTMEVNIWGSVRSPGRYEVSTATDLVQLVSYAGGPTAEASFDDVLVTRTIRNEDGTLTRQEYTVDLEDLTKTDEKHLMLRPGDTIYVDTGSWLVTRDILYVVSVTAIVVTATANAIWIVNR